MKKVGQGQLCLRPGFDKNAMLQTHFLENHICKFSSLLGPLPRNVSSPVHLSHLIGRYFTRESITCLRRFALEGPPLQIFCTRFLQKPADLSNVNSLTLVYVLSWQNCQFPYNYMYFWLGLVNSLTTQLQTLHIARVGQVRSLLLLLHANRERDSWNTGGCNRHHCSGQCHYRCKKTLVNSFATQLRTLQESQMQPQVPPLVRSCCDWWKSDHTLWKWGVCVTH